MSQTKLDNSKISSQQEQKQISDFSISISIENDQLDNDQHINISEEPCHDFPPIIQKSAPDPNLADELKINLVSRLQKQRLRSALGLDNDNAIVSEADLEDQMEVGIRKHNLKNKTYEEHVGRFYDNRAFEMSILFWILTLNNFYYTILTTLDAYSKLILSIYWCLTISSMVIMIMSFLKKDMKYVRPALALLTIRNMLRIYNFENQEDTPYQQVIQNLICLFLGQTYIVNSQRTRVHLYFGRFVIIFYTTGVCKAFQLLDFENTKMVILSLFYILMGTLVCYAFLMVQSRTIDDLFKQFATNFEQQDEFKQILDYLEESIIIMSKQKIEFVNDKFLIEFYQKMIKYLPETKEQTEIQKSFLSEFTSNLKRSVKELFSRVSHGQDQAEQSSDIVNDNPALKIKLFKIFKITNQQTTCSVDDDQDLKTRTFSIQDVIQQYSEENLSNKIFYNYESTKKYFQIKMKKFYRMNEEKVMLQFIDISKSILLDFEKSSNQVLEMINACVSHEMRNPLNSIIAQNLEKKFLYQELSAKIQNIQNEAPREMDEVVQQCQQIVLQLQGGMRVQESSAQFLHYMVQDLLDYAQIKSGKFRQNVDQFDILEAVEDVMIIQQRKAQDNKIHLHASFPNIYDPRSGNLPQTGDHDSLVQTDKQRVMQVLLCLQSNALKFTQNGEVHIEVSIVKEPQGLYLKMAVKDTGVGISKENQEKLFKFFGFLENTQLINKNGVGLGLVISKQIAEIFGGSITVESEEGVGSVFTARFKLQTEIQLEEESMQEIEEPVLIKKFSQDTKKLWFEWSPLMKESSKEINYVNNLHLIYQSSNLPQSYLSPRQSQLLRQNSDTFLQPKIRPSQNFIRPRPLQTTIHLPKVPFYPHKILIVDDQSFNIDAIRIILKYSIGLDSKQFCHQALSGKQALQMVTDDINGKEKGGFCTYNLILMDLNMPEMDGNEAMSRIREQIHLKGMQQPIISAVTGHTEQVYIDQAIKGGMNQVFSKPLNPDYLSSIVLRLGYPCYKKKT